MSEIALSSDVYQTKEALHDLWLNFIDDEDEEVLELGLYGWLSSVLAKETSSAIRIAAEMSNEMFPHKARLESSIIAHAIMQNITDIFAKPAVMSCLLCIKEDDLQKIFEDQYSKDNTNTCIIDNKCKFLVGEYEYHLDYPIIISRTTISNFKTVYTARYDISDKNTLSNVTNPYLDAPYLLRTNGDVYLFIPTHLSQYIITEKSETLSSDNIIDNKSYQFTFENQLATFDVYVTDGEDRYRLTPIFESATPDTDGYYCRYTFLSENTIRVTFDSASYVPGVGAVVKTVIKTTLGSACNFTIKDPFLNVLQDTDDYSYMNTPIMIRPIDKSTGGEDRISVSELKKKIPKESSSRGNITSTTDLSNYFNKLNTDKLRIHFKEKVNNQFMFEYYSYILARDSSNNIVPTNTLNVEVSSDQLYVSHDTEGDSYIMNPGMCFGYNGGIAEYISDPTEENMSKYKFTYTIPFKSVINPSVPAIFFYMNIMNKTYMLNFDYMNDSCPIQFICTSLDWRRDPSDPDNGNKYILNLTVTQNIDEDYGIVYELQPGDPGYVEPTDPNEPADPNEPVDPDNPEEGDNTDEPEGPTDSTDEPVDDSVDENASTAEGSADYAEPDDPQLVDNYINANRPITVLRGASSVSGGTSDIESDSNINSNNILGSVTELDGNGGATTVTNPNDEMEKTLSEVSVIDAMGADVAQNSGKDVTKVFDPTDNDFINTICNLRAIAVCKKEGIPVRYFRSKLLEPPEEGDYSYGLAIEFVTDDSVDKQNDINIINGYNVEKDNTSESRGHIYLPQNTETDIYILVQFKDDYGDAIEFGRYDLDNIISPEITKGYSVTNKYTIDGGLDFFDNFSDIIHSVVTAKNKETESGLGYTFNLSNIPMINYNYAQDKDKLNEFIDKLKDEKNHINNILNILDNAFTVDFKLYNTYGPSEMYYTIDSDGIKKSIGKTNLSIELSVKLRKDSDDYTIEYIRKDVKDYIESFDNIEQDIHIPNLISELIQKYSNSVYYIEFKGFNIEYTETESGVSDATCTCCTDIDNCTCISCPHKTNSGKKLFGTDCQHLLYKTDSIEKIPEFVNIDTLKDGTPNIIINKL